MRVDQDYGEARTWDEAVDRALALHEEGKIDAVATVSVNEFGHGNYVATPLRGMGFSEEQVIENYRALGPVLYPGHERLRLVQVEMPGFHPEYPEKVVLSVLEIIYLKSGENVTVRAR